MSISLEKARAYLETLEAERRAALALSEQKAEEARLMKARAEGFQAAMEILAGEIDGGSARSGKREPARRRVRRPIRQLILRELSFSGRTMSVTQIAKAIDYHSGRTETALRRMEAAGQLVRSGEGRWAIGIGAMAQLNEHAVARRNGKASGSGNGLGSGRGGNRPGSPKAARCEI
jgi:hypothetical protein